MKLMDIKIFSCEEAEAFFTFNRFDNSEGTGYQRNISEARIRKMIKACKKNKSWPFPAINVVINHDNSVEVVEGQHRALSAIEAGIDIPALVWDIPKEAERAEAFVEWNQGYKPTNTHIIAVSQAGPAVKAAYAKVGVALQLRHSWAIEHLDYRNAVVFLANAMGQATPTNVQAMIDFVLDNKKVCLEEAAQYVSTIRKTFIENRPQPESKILAAIIDLSGRVTLKQRDVMRISAQCKNIGKSGSATDELTKLAILAAYNYGQADSKRLMAWPVRNSLSLTEIKTNHD